MGSAQEKGVKEGRAPQTRGKISSLSKEGGNMEQEEEGIRARHDNKDPACTE